MYERDDVVSILKVLAKSGGKTLSYIEVAIKAGVSKKNAFDVLSLLIKKKYVRYINVGTENKYFLNTENNEAVELQKFYERI